MNNKEISKTNRKAWNEAMFYHQKARENALVEGFADPGFTTFDRDCDKALLEKLQRVINLKDKTIAQLPCNNGRELLSLMRLGATKGFGFDVSDAAIEEAHKLAKIAKLNVHFKRIDILDIDPEYDDTFDFVYISEGSLQWFPNLNDYLKIIARLLKKNGLVLIYEMHPCAYFFEQGFNPDEDKNFDKMVSYFQKGPYSYEDGLDYIGEIQYQAKECHWFMHKMSDIITAMIKNNMQILEFEEYNVEMANNAVSRLMDKFPLSYMMIVKKK